MLGGKQQNRLPRRSINQSGIDWADLFEKEVGTKETWGEINPSIFSEFRQKISWAEVNGYPQKYQAKLREFSKYTSVDE